MASEQSVLAQTDWVGFGKLRFRAIFAGAISSVWLENAIALSDGFSALVLKQNGSR